MQITNRHFRHIADTIWQELDRQHHLSDLEIRQIGGAFGSLVTFVTLWQFRSWNQLALITETVEQAESIRDDLYLLGYHDVAYNLPHPQNHRVTSRVNQREQTSDLLEIQHRLQHDLPTLLIGPPGHFLQPVEQSREDGAPAILLKTGGNLETAWLAERLVDSRYERVDFISEIGEFAIRGGIIDLFAYGNKQPVRIELDDDRIEQIRAFDLNTQITTEILTEVTILTLPGEEHAPSIEFLLAMPNHIPLLHTAVEWPLEEQENPTAITERINKNRINITTNFSTAKSIYGVQSHAIHSYINHTNDLAERIRTLHGSGYQIFILCDNNGQLERLTEILESEQLDLQMVQFVIGSLHRGFVLENPKLAVFTDHELFDRRKPKRQTKRFRRSIRLDELRKLNPGDFVVHVHHGVGRFDGLTHIQVLGHEREVVRISYSDNDALFVPVDHLDEIAKYSGTEGTEPKIHRLGSQEWQRTKKRTKKAIQEIAQDLIELYARRKTIRGIEFSDDTTWQKEVEAAFEFDETDDQLQAIVDVKHDMQNSSPMDRLICGDVGYGKTEVAIRAAFKAVMDGFQVAVLVPTTILAEQHYRTFQERIRPFPLKINVLSRFRSPAQQKDILGQLVRGELDIVIGTHRLLSKDVKFHRLGLLIVDEEQRFGVNHKEKIKQMAEKIDSLTMTATPIPRTLSMALMGARDLSAINTPPANRLPIETQVAVFNQEIITDAIMQELSRGGQVYFVHNRVQSIHSIQHMLHEILPDVRTIVGHGQMKERELEKVMMDFMNHRYDILISTMIIENGLDIPNVNTLIVNRADHLGLSQLYQLRGRIGRSHRQAYALLLIPPRRKITETARRRLETIAEFTDLGAGFAIAQRDLEIRGAGNLLGKAQSGFINKLGFDVYNRILDEAVRELKGETQPASELEVKIMLPADALFPADYIESDTERLNLYRQLNDITQVEEIEKFARELTDRFGKVPAQARRLLQVFRLRYWARTLRIGRVDLRNEISALLPLPIHSTKDLPDWIARLGQAGNEWDFHLTNEMPPQVKLALEPNSWESRLQVVINFLSTISRDSTLSAAETTATNSKS